MRDSMCSGGRACESWLSVHSQLCKSPWIPSAASNKIPGLSSAIINLYVHLKTLTNTHTHTNMLTHYSTIKINIRQEESPPFYQSYFPKIIVVKNLLRTMPDFYVSVSVCALVPHIHIHRNGKIPNKFVGSWIFFHIILYFGYFFFKSFIYLTSLIFHCMNALHLLKFSSKLFSLSLQIMYNEYLVHLFLYMNANTVQNMF